MVRGAGLICVTCSWYALLVCMVAGEPQGPISAIKILYRMIYIGATPMETEHAIM